LRVSHWNPVAGLSCGTSTEDSDLEVRPISAGYSPSSVTFTTTSIICWAT
jgi:hypothetical protein